MTSFFIPLNWVELFLKPARFITLLSAIDGVKRQVNLGDRMVTIVGTSHVSRESMEEVQETIDEVQPDLVGVELDQDRYESLKESSGWKDMDLAEAIRDGKGYLLLMNLLLSIYQRRMGMEQGMEPGTEMLRAVEAAEENGIEYALLDRDITETFERLREETSLFGKSKLLASLFAGGEEIDVEELTEPNVLDTLLEGMKEEFPSLQKVFLDERNDYMADRLVEQDFDHAVIVVGAAHVEGLVESLEEETREVVEPGKNFPWMKVLSYAIPVFILGMLGYSFYRIGAGAALEGAGFWVLANGVLAMLGAIIARSHIATWIVSFLAAPLTSLDPALGAGMVASYFEGRVYPPTVGELEDVVYLTSYGELWGNQAGRILLTFFFVTLGSAAATFLGAGYIASLFF
jgi:pheromone shutdown-related protein TraB